MSRFYFAVVVAFLFNASHLNAQTTASRQDNTEPTTLFEDYYNAFLKMNPVVATFIGDNRYNDLFYIDFTDSFRVASRNLFNRYLTTLKNMNEAHLNDADKINYAVLKRELEMNLERLAYNDHYMVFHQMGGWHNYFAAFGSGSVVQPFKTATDYNNWLRRASVFPAWADSAVVYFRKGAAAGMVLPKAAVVKIIPQLDAVIANDPAKSVFYGPIATLPNSFSEAEKKRFTDAYTKLITEQINPAYKRLSDFFKNEYLPKARATSGHSALPDGTKLYDLYVRYFTTTHQTPDEIYNTGLSEVARIQQEMEGVKNQVGYDGDLKKFFEYMRTDPRFFPYKTPEDVLNAYRAVQQKIDPNLKRMFNQVPKTPFEIRQTEAFRAASSAAQYVGGSLENNRPGIFYVPIVEATKTKMQEALFLHEAIPGHHYQVSLQNENKALPMFRRYGNFAAYSEGWGLYAESLGKELGVYSDPYQYMYALGSEIHRAIRLVVDVGLHTKGWTREQAIQYMLDNMPISEQFATSEVERYMVMPGQALAYKTGELKIKELRDRYSKQLGNGFNLAAFHDEILKDGAMPLDVLERKMDAWAAKQKR